MSSRRGSAQISTGDIRTAEDSTVAVAREPPQRDQPDIWPDTTDDEGFDAPRTSEQYVQSSEARSSISSEVEKPALDIWPDTEEDEGSQDTESQDTPIVERPRSPISQMNHRVEIADEGEASHGDHDQELASGGMSKGATPYDEAAERSEMPASTKSQTGASSEPTIESKPRSQSVGETVGSLKQPTDTSSTTSAVTLNGQGRQWFSEHPAEKEARDYIALISPSRSRVNGSSTSKSSSSVADPTSTLPATPSHLLNLNNQSYFSLKPVERKGTAVNQSTRSSEVAEVIAASRTPSFARVTRQETSTLSVRRISTKDELPGRRPTSVDYPQYAEKAQSPHAHMQSPTTRILAPGTEVSSLTSIACHKEHHSKLSELVRNAIIGFSDGLTVPFALVAGLSALENRKVTVLGGLAELFAGTLSMGLGALLAAFTERTRYDSEEKREWREVMEEPQAEEEEIFQILGDYGISRNASTPVVESLKSNKDMWVKFMMDFELQLKKPTKREAYLEALVMGVSYFIGGIFPLIPFLVLSEEKIYMALFCAIGVSAALLLLFGFAKSKAAGATHKKAFLGAIQMLCIGALAAGLSYAVVWGILKA